MDTNNILLRLSNKDKKEISQCAISGAMFPRMSKDGQILPSQWKSWQTFQRYSLGFIRGSPENCQFEISEKGKELAERLNKKI